MSISPFKQAIRKLKTEQRKWATVGQRTPKQVNRWFKWLSPGLFVKRWLLISATGLLLTLLGLAIWVKLTPVNRLLELISQLLQAISNYVPSYISGPLALILGLFLLLWGQSRTVGSITEAFPEGDEELVDRLLAHRRLNRGPKIAAIGGGTGLSTLLRGLKQYSANITAIVTVADDGGSSGRLRDEIGVLPPGDIRNCVAALADEEKLLTELFQYRFQAGDGLTGHSFGNLFLTAMTEVMGGDFEKAIAASSKVLAIRGKVLPATLSDVRLWAELDDGRLIEGESHITEAGGKIRHLGCLPANPPALPAALQAIKEAEYIVIGPGSLYTSLIPNLLVPEIKEALMKVKVPRIYVCNIMTQPGETEGYTVANHIEAIERICGQGLIDAVLVQRIPPSPYALKRYAQENCHPVYLDREDVVKLGCRIILANVMEEDSKTGKVRHQPQRLARILLRWYSER
ncbi:gluconeogenesis factor YvcK family protein [Crocosphaera sp. XPORK-15E]|uniref:gluconeogenesis factor YvcK family protein n=1 Tax=Crocosphaera sp. XPORK-15E TaxID=3110247 RepID=UPI002B2190E3|nr:gluconeogenesis factor YvcK family protein [Crocosphaera sp. XPORK-15E]MEA5535568.1 gluconeogenesis factor YvcK family protein [Crocosphaera sp. XPORK-15E]